MGDNLTGEIHCLSRVGLRAFVGCPLLEFKCQKYILSTTEDGTGDGLQDVLLVAIDGGVIVD
jgi:hypothetical protein